VVVRRRAISFTARLPGRSERQVAHDISGGDFTTIKGLAPLSELADYQTRLKSVTGGQGSYSIDFRTTRRCRRTRRRNW